MQQAPLQLRGRAEPARVEPVVGQHLHWQRHGQLEPGIQQRLPDRAGRQLLIASSVPANRAPPTRATRRH